MRTKSSIAWWALALVGVVCLGLIAGTRSAQADTAYNISGTGGVTTTFNAQANANATITFTQENGIFRYTSGSVARAWGRFHVDVTLNGSTQRYEWQPTTGGQTFVLQLSQKGFYTITVTPWTSAEMRTQLSGFSTWNTLPAWSVTSVSGCALYAASSPTATSQAVTASVTIYYRDAAGNTLQTFTRSCSVGTSTITAPLTLQSGAYTLISPQSQTVTLYANGTLSASSVVFYYTAVSVATPTPTPLLTASVTVYYRDSTGALLQTRSVQITQGSKIITAPATLQSGAYVLASPSSQTVTLYANGTLSASSVTFYYTANNPATPTPTPVSATVTVYYRAIDGSLLESRTQACSVGSNTVSAPASLQNGAYTLASESVQTVTLYASGTLSASSVTFYYAPRQIATPTPEPVITASVMVYYRSTDGTLLQSRFETCRRGTNTITAPDTLQNGAYVLSSSKSQPVTLYANGTLSTQSVTFYYTRIPTVSATITVQLRDADTMSILSSRTVTLGVGTHTVQAGSTPSGYQAISSTSATVTVYSDGTASPSVVTFDYRRRQSATAVPVVTHDLVYPTSWDTKFRPEISTNSSNNWRWQELDKLTDGNASTYFQYYLYTSDTENGYPEFTAYFSNSTVQGIGIRNGVSSGYSDYMRIIRMHAIIYTTSGTYTVENLTVPDTYQLDYYWLSFGRSYTDVEKIEIYVDQRRKGNVTDYQYLIRIRDLCFY